MRMHSQSVPVCAVWLSVVRRRSAGVVATHVLLTQRLHAAPITGNKWGHEGMLHFAWALPRTRITALQANDCALGDYGAMTLAPILPDTAIEVLDFGGECAGGSASIHSQGCDKVLCLLLLCRVGLPLFAATGNGIHYAGFQALGDAFADMPSLTSVDLSGVCVCVPCSHYPSML